VEVLLPILQRTLLPPSSVLNCWSWEREDLRGGSKGAPLRFTNRHSPTHRTSALTMETVCSSEGPAITEAVSCQLLTAEVRFRAQDSTCGISDGHSVSGTGCFPRSSVFPCQYHSSVPPQCHASSAGVANKPFSGLSFIQI
jgi:hypothetical protein